MSSPRFLEIIGMGQPSESRIPVSIETALSVPAVWSAVNFLAGTLAGLPIHVYEREGETRKRVRGGIDDLIGFAPNDETSSFEWRKHKFDGVFTGGRGVSFIERNGKGDVIGLWGLDPTHLSIERREGRRSYVYRDGGRTIRYEASEVIDLPFMLRENGVGHRGPIAQCRDAIGLALGATKFGSRFFENGGVPPFAIQGNFQSEGAMMRAGEDLRRAVEAASSEGRQAIAVPAGIELKPLGTDAEKSQLVELKRFCVEEIARVYSMPPVFLQDLTHGTFANTEQQDLHYVKHTLSRWVRAFEQELTLKIFGRAQRRFYVEMNVDGILRGDFKTRMEGYQRAINSALMTPNEARRRENLPDDDSGGLLMIQGATVPVGSVTGQSGGQEDEA